MIFSWIREVSEVTALSICPAAVFVCSFIWSVEWNGVTEGIHHNYNIAINLLYVSAITVSTEPVQDSYHVWNSVKYKSINRPHGITSTHMRLRMIYRVIDKEIDTQIKNTAVAMHSYSIQSV